MITKQILGIYIDRESFHYVSAVKGVGGVRLKSPGVGMVAERRQTGNSHRLLKNFLKHLPPDKKREIYLALPRSQVFARQITLPPMAVEDAISSIESSLAVYAHLEPEKICYDIQLSKNGNKVSRGNSGIEALLYYAAKTEIEKIQKLFSDTGHITSLTGIFPLSYGVAALWNIKQGDAPKIFCLDQERESKEGVTEIAVASHGGLLLTMTSPLDGEEENILLLKGVQNKFPQADAPLFLKNNDLSTASCRKVCQNLPSLKKNLASGAIAPSLVKFQNISLDETPVKIKIFRPMRYIFLFLSLLIIGFYFMTDSLNKTTIREEGILHGVEKEVGLLESRLAPLQEKIDTLKKAAAFKDDVEKFTNTRPGLYSLINEIASLAPEETWFSSFSFNHKKIVLRGRGKDALKTVELLRSSPLLDSVALKGSVNRSSKGEERFTVTLKPGEKKESKDTEKKESGDTEKKESGDTEKKESGDTEKKSLETLRKKMDSESKEKGKR